MKEQAILNLGKMLSKHGKAEGMCSSVLYTVHTVRLQLTISLNGAYMVTMLVHV